MLQVDMANSTKQRIGGHHNDIPIVAMELNFPQIKRDMHNVVHHFLAITKVDDTKGRQTPFKLNQIVVGLTWIFGKFSNTECETILNS